MASGSRNHFIMPCQCASDTFLRNLMGYKRFEAPSRSALGKISSDSTGQHQVCFLTSVFSFVFVVVFLM